MVAQTKPLPLKVYAPVGATKPHKPADMVTSAHALVRGRQLICLCPTPASATLTAHLLEQAGLRTDVVIGKLTPRQRMTESRRIQNRHVDIICTDRRDLSDFPTADGLILLRFIPQSTVWLRTVMAAKRPRPRKTEAFLFDFGGNVLYHGLPE